MMTATESLAGFDEEEWTILYSTPEAAYPPYPHLALPAPVPPQNSQQMYGSPPEYPAFQSVANQNHPTIYSPWSHLSRAVDSVTTGLGRLALHTPAAIPPTFSQQHPSPITPLAPSTGNEPLSAPAAHPTALPASMQSRSSRRARTDSLADFIGRENGRSVCMWTNSAGEVCGYGSRYGLVKRHVRRVHLRVRHFSCAICGRMFFDRHGHSVHLNSHTGKKPYQCHECGLFFTSPASRYYHRKTSHSYA